MTPLQQLIDSRNHKALSIKEIVDAADAQGRPMHADEIANFDRLAGEVEALEVQIKAVQDTAERAAKMAVLNDRLAAPAGRTTQPDKPATAAPTASTNPGLCRIPATAARTRPLKAFKGTINGVTAEQRAYRAGMWARAAVFNDQRAQHWCLVNGVGTDIRNAMGTNQNTTGGFLVPEEFSSTVIDLREMYGVFRQNCYVQPMGRDTMTVPRRLTGLTIGPVGENPTSGISQSTPTFNQVRLTAKKAGGLALMSTEVAEDAVIDLADWLAQEFAYGFAKFEDQCGFTGDGTSTYLGINGLTNLFTAAAGLAGAVDAASGHDTFAEIDATDLATVMAKLPAYARPNAKWYVSSVGFDLVFGRLMAAAGGNTIQNMEGGYQPRYMGHDIVISQVLPTSTGDLSDLAMLFFGDLEKSSTLGDRRDVRVFPSEHRYMDTDQIGVRGTMRIDIVNHDVGTTTEAGPIVALVGE